MERRIVVGTLATAAAGAVVAGLAAFGTGAGGGRESAAAAESAQAVVQLVRGDLVAGFYAPGGSYGGVFTQGTLVQQVEQHGGVLLTMAADPARATNRATLLLDVDGTPTCYALSFGLGAASVRAIEQACPARVDVAAARRMLERRLPSVDAVVPGQYATDGSGVRALLARATVTTSAARADSAVVETTTAGGVLSGTARIEGVCYILRLGGPATQQTVPLWQAPLDDQPTCGAAQAAAASGTFGEDPAQAG
ncbi:hypothetical protein [Streptacidiphilus jiangxiensis]|uniref:Uncharacterized protein n=1 Tax=Streptacidiphilus jiangxiensis TaxID=235985 RepID=A0A1H7J190_STRJI|nr:hypothetical protein [Streptacidiphilus jiangxiensis]SEK67972.1 hypothetical protein SAMN05414137_10388 [Streptacidiphilus jiangxiensis]